MPVTAIEDVWLRAVAQGIETATFHILTPYPGTKLFERLDNQGRILTKDWDLYDTRHAVFQPAGMTPDQLEQGYWRASEGFYRWSNILAAAWTKPTATDRIRHMAYSGAWKKFESTWSLLVKLGLLPRMLPVLESVLSAFGHYPADAKRAAVRHGKTVSEAQIC